MKKMFVLLFVVLFVATTAVVATATSSLVFSGDPAAKTNSNLFDLIYSDREVSSPIPGQQMLQYNFTLLYNGNGGDELGLMTTGAVFSDPPTFYLTGGQWGLNPTKTAANVKITGSYPGPWSYLENEVGYFNGSVFGDSSLFWKPEKGGYLTWTALSSTDLSGKLNWAYVDENYAWTIGPATYLSATVKPRLGEYDAPTPEPGTFLLMGTGLIGLCGLIRRRR